MLTYQQAKDIEDALGPQQAGPLLAVLQDLDRKIENQKNAVKADLLLELATKADIANVRTEIADVRTEIANLRTELKGDIANLRTEIDEVRSELKIEIAKIYGEFKSIRLWMKLLVAIGILGMTFFSPTTIKLLEMLK
jgi:DNA repair exonuclease SbcCD ATPase subunit